jgi:hypothetical protein
VARRSRVECKRGRNMDRWLDVPAHVTGTHVDFKKPQLHEMWHFEYFSKMFREYSCFIRIWQQYRILYMKTWVTLGQHLVEFFLEWETFESKAVEKIKKIHFMFSTSFFFRKSCRLWDNVEKYCTAGHVSDGNMAHAHCKLDSKICRHVLRIGNNYCPSTATMVRWTCLIIRLYVHCLHYCFNFCILIPPPSLTLSHKVGR